MRKPGLDCTCAVTCACILIIVGTVTGQSTAPADKVAGASLSRQAASGGHCRSFVPGDAREQC
ncbi:hypothetical protein MNEG_9495, partial [Monoraphidium neglectum]